MRFVRHATRGMEDVRRQFKRRWQHLWDLLGKNKIFLNVESPHIPILSQIYLITSDNNTNGICPTILDVHHSVRKLNNWLVHQWEKPHWKGRTRNRAFLALFPLVYINSELFECTTPQPGIVGTQTSIPDGECNKLNSNKIAENSWE